MKENAKNKQLADVDESIDLEDEEAAGDVEVLDPEEDEALDLEEELHPDDVEVPLDIALRERTASPLHHGEEEGDAPEEEEDDDEGTDLGESDGRIRPKRPGEFVCSSCFLVKHPSQLSDKKRSLCRDCV